jgi:hypothetical protein
MRADVRAVLEDSGPAGAKSSIVPPKMREKRPSSVPPPSRAPTSDLGAPRSDPPPAVTRSSRSKQRLIDLAPTTTIQDPSETKEALTEARKRLVAGAVPLPPGSPHAITDPPGAPRNDSMRIVIAGILVLAIGVGVWLATR